jgi:uncharacterized protein (DUF433 family)
MEQLASYISIDQDIRFGKPCIKGTRITVTDILQWLASGMTHQEIMDDYPSIQEIHIRAALSFAANREAFIKIITAA